MKQYRLQLLALALLVGPVTSHATAFAVTNLVTDDQLANPAQITDASLVNAWGMATSPTSPFWVSDNGTGVSTLYRVDPLTNATVKLGLTVTIPGAGNVTGQAFSTMTGGNFNGDNFLFVSEDGTVSGWRGALGTTAEVLQLGSADNVYKGVAFATVAGSAYLYAANFHSGHIDVLKGNGGTPNLVGSFTDPALPAGYAPFNIQNIGGNLYVTYALQDANGPDEVAGPGNGFVDVFDLQGNFIARIATQGTLNAPWGMALAPSSFEQFAGDLLVGNFGDGRINIFDLGTHAYLGQMTDEDGNTLAIDGLWGLLAGNGGSGGSPQSIYFAAGPFGESHGLFGVISKVPEPGTLALLGLGLLGLGATRRRRT